ncbi:MAG TPA: FAD-dependent oxidoreductase [Jiangellaceae bacterium]
MARIIVVGAGVSGLATAARLADFGHDVLVFERNATTGGRVGRYRKDGFAFDTGPHLLTLPAVYRDLFRKTGRPLERVVDLVPAEPAVHLRFADGTDVELPNASRAGISRALDDALGTGNGSAWHAVVDRGRQVWQVLRSPYLEATPGLKDLARLAGPTRRRALGPRQTLRALVDELVPDRRLAMAVEHFARGADPRRSPAALAAVPYLMETFGRWRVEGGMRRLADALAERATERGAKIRTGCPVTEITVDSGRASGVRLAGGAVETADAVVAAVDARCLYGDLLTAPAAGRLSARLRSRLPAPADFTMFLAVSGYPVDLPPHTVLLPADPDAASDAVFGPEPAAPREPAIDVYAADDPALRPDDGSRAVTVQAVVPPHGPLDWSSREITADYAEHLLTVMAARGLDLRPHLRWHATWSPYDAEHATGVPGGAAWGLGIGSAWDLLRRPGNRAPAKALFHVGSSSYPGPGLPLVGLSSALVADLIGRA